jgi:hypothetical protein
MLYMIDGFGDGWNGASWTLKAAGGEAVVAGPYTFSSGASATQVFTAWTTPTSVPTATPTNAGDTNAPTSSPTATSNWNQLKNKCNTTSACNTGGCTIVLGDDFVMGSYNGEIDFSGKTITIWGQGKVLDASGGGRFFSGVGAGSFLELHEAVLQNGQADSVSGRVLELFWQLLKAVLKCSLIFLLQFLTGHMELRFDPPLHRFFSAGSANRMNG